MDAIVGLLDGPRARGAFLLRALMDPPWSVRVQDEAPLSLLAMVRGDAWVVPDRRGKTTHLGPGDVAITRGADPYTFADDPATPRIRLNRRRGGAAGRLCQPLRPQHRLQAGPRCQPAAAPSSRAGEMSATSSGG